VQLFDTEQSMACSVAAFLHAGVQAEQALLVAATATHWTCIEAELRQRGVACPALRRRGSLTILDADDTLARLMRRGQPVSSLFAESVGAAVRRLAAESPNGLRIYGELVEVLAQEGNYGAAARLEDLWNELGVECSFTLLCGYSSAHFAGPDAGSALARICGQHSASICGSADPLGHFLIDRMDRRRVRAAV
jgi:hypothetical protein